MNLNFREKFSSILRYKICNRPFARRDFEMWQNRNRSTNHTIALKENNSNPKDVLLAKALVASISFTRMAQLLRVLIGQGSHHRKSRSNVRLTRAQNTSGNNGSWGHKNFKMLDHSTDPTKLSMRIYSQFRTISPTKNHESPYWILAQINSIIIYWQILPIIRGTDKYGKIILEGLKKIEFGLIGQNNKFGWILSGQMERSN
ncbi:hypothetical protein JTB14_023869 [Gonioctena quinquepunctata]|nr:hypothetical protein JTB14_023869 [Gonioctena quinquepunctata]